MGLVFIMKSKYLLFEVFGENKVDVVKGMIEGLDIFELLVSIL